MDKPHMSGAEARQPQGADRRPHGLYDGWNRHYQAIDDDEVYLSAVEGFLPREAGVPQQAVAQVFRLGDARNENVRHNSRFDQQDSHFDDPLCRRGSSFRSPAEGQIRTDCGAASSAHVYELSVSFPHGEPSVKTVAA